MELERGINQKEDNKIWLAGVPAEGKKILTFLELRYNNPLQNEIEMKAREKWMDIKVDKEIRWLYNNPSINGIWVYTAKLGIDSLKRNFNINKNRYR